MVAESACISIPSELIMTFGGALAAGAVPGTHLNLAGVIIAGAAGNVVGSYIAWAVGDDWGPPPLRPRGRAVRSGGDRPGPGHGRVLSRGTGRPDAPLSTPGPRRASGCPGGKPVRAPGPPGARTLGSNDRLTSVPVGRDRIQAGDGLPPRRDGQRTDGSEQRERGRDGHGRPESAGDTRGRAQVPVRGEDRAADRDRKDSAERLAHVADA